MIPQHLYLSQSIIVSLVPGVGGVLSVVHMAMLYSLYSFEYKWIYLGIYIHSVALSDHIQNDVAKLMSLRIHA